MNLVAMTIPDNPADLPGWLERHLTGLELSALVAELSAVHGANATQHPPLRDVLGNQARNVAQRGLAVLPTGTIRQLLRHPMLLLDLQAYVLEHGGAYWDRLLDADTSLDASVRGGDTRLADYIAETIPPAAIPLRTPWYRKPALVMVLTMAATIAAVVLIPWQSLWTPPGTQEVVQSGWGWSKPGAIPEDVDAREYLNRLADGAHEWFNKTPDNAVALAERISEFRQGCSKLILAPHEPLSEDDREWLVEKCQAWAKNIDAHLTELESTGDVAVVRVKMDETVNQLINALRNQAEKAAAA